MVSSCDNFVVVVLVWELCNKLRLLYSFLVYIFMFVLSVLVYCQTFICDFRWRQFCLLKKKFIFIRLCRNDCISLMPVLFSVKGWSINSFQTCCLWIHGISRVSGVGTSQMSLKVGGVFHSDTSMLLGANFDNHERYPWIRIIRQIVKEIYHVCLKLMQHSVCTHKQVNPLTAWARWTLPCCKRHKSSSAPQSRGLIWIYVSC